MVYFIKLTQTNNMGNIWVNIDKHTAARLIVPEPSDEDKQLTEKLQAYTAELDLLRDLRDEMKLNITAMNKASAELDLRKIANDQLKREKAELFDMVLKVGIRARHCDNCSEFILSIVKKAHAIANATEKQEKG